MSRLTDPWFQAAFYGNVTEYGYRLQGEKLDGAQGLFLWCPCGYGKPAYPLEGPRPHAIIVPFANPRNAQVAPANHGPVARDQKTHPRWAVTGTGLDDLTISPSVDVDDPSCWHGHIKNGEVAP